MKSFLISCAVALLLVGAVTGGDCDKNTLSTLPAEHTLRLPILKNIESTCTLYKHNPDDTILGYTSGYTTGD